MRLQDELLALYPISGAPVRQYILGKIASLPIHYDSEALETLLDSARGRRDPTVAAHAILAWHHVGPRLATYAHGLSGDRLGLWSTLAARARSPAGGAPAAEGEDEGAEPEDGQRAALAPLLAPCREALLAAAERAGAAGDLAREVLGLVPLPGADAVLRTAARDPGCAPSAMLALARCQRALAAGALAGERLLPLWIRTLAAGPIGGEEAARVCHDAIAKGDEPARWGAAMAIPSLPGDLWRPVARGLMAAEGGWVRVLVMDALGQVALRVGEPGGPAAEDILRPLDRGLKDAEHDMIRGAALRAMAVVKHELCVRRARRCLEQGSPNLQVAAIEALARLDAGDDATRGLLARRMAGGPAKLSAAAALGLMRRDADTAMQGAVTLARSAEGTDRLEGAFCLGYLQCPTSLDLLSILARSDRFLPAARQAEHSLAHYPEAEAGLALVRLLGHEEPAIALGALAVLSHFPGESAREVVGPLVALEARLSGQDLRAMLRQAGRLGPVVQGVPEFLARERTDPDGVIGALEGMARAGRISGPMPARAAAASDPRIAVAGALAQVLGGDGAGFSVLGRWASDTRGALDALAALRTLAVLAGEAGRGGRHRALQRLLGIRKSRADAPRVATSASGPSRPVGGHAGAAGAAAERVAGSFPERDVRDATPPAAAGRGGAAASPASRARGALGPALQPARPDDSPATLRRTVGTDRDGLARELSDSLARVSPPGGARPAGGRPPAGARESAAARVRPKASGPAAGDAAGSPGSSEAAGQGFVQGRLLEGGEDDWPLRITSIEDAGLALLSGARSLRWLPAPLRPYAPLLVVPLAIAIPVCITLAHLPSRMSPAGAGGKGAPIARGHLRVSEVKGTATLVSPGKVSAPLALHGHVGPGDQVSTGPSSRLVLTGAGGNTIWMEESSELRIGDPRTDATTPALDPVVVTDVRGDVLLDFRKAPALEVVLGADRIAAQAATVRILDSGASRVVSLAEGSGTLLSPGSPPSVLRPGHPVTLSAR